VDRTTIKSCLALVAFCAPFCLEKKFLKSKLNPLVFAGVERIESEAGDSFLMASPLKALADYVYLNKMPWSSAKPLRESLRVEEEDLDSLREEDFAGISNCYQSGVARRFLSGLQKDLLG